jgi:potassium/hydrogen antiporter
MQSAAAVPLERLFLVLAVLLLLSILGSKASGRLGIPALVLFLFTGMLAGSEGIGGIWFNDPGLAQAIGVVALVFILFAGGLDTNWSFVRRSVGRAAILATLGVALTAAILGAFVHWFLDLGWIESFLLGAIVSSTDAAAVFSILRSKGVKLREDIAATLELESGSNDPMAVFLTTLLIGWLGPGQHSISAAGLDFLQQMVFGGALGIGIGLLAVFFLNRITLDASGLYPVLTIAVALFGYGFTQWVGGNGFLAVYAAGIVMANRNFVARRTLVRFHDGIAWLMQIAMFLVLGLLVFPSAVRAVAVPGLIVGLFLMFVARPLAVYLTLAFSGLDFRAKTLVAWVGLRGAVPIILATFPLLAGVPQAGAMFNIVFFIVLTSVLVQGTTLSLVAKWLKMDKPLVKDVAPSERDLPQRPDTELATVEVVAGSRAAGKRMVEIRDWPREASVLVLYRGEEFTVPTGSTEILPGDRLIVLTSRSTIDQVRRLASG